eukprot:14394264-Heterocapsa_arctica.AAC.1
MFVWREGNTMRKEKDLIANIPCTGAPDRAGHRALQAIRAKQPLPRSRVRSDAKVASGLGMEAAG